MHCIVLCCIVLYCIALYYILFHYIVLHCAYCTVLYCAISYCKKNLSYTVLYCLILSRIVLYCIALPFVLYCIVQYKTQEQTTYQQSCSSIVAKQLSHMLQLCVRRFGRQNSGQQNGHNHSSYLCPRRGINANAKTIEQSASSATPARSCSKLF